MTKNDQHVGGGPHEEKSFMVRTTIVFEEEIFSESRGDAEKTAEYIHTPETPDGRIVRLESEVIRRVR